METIKTIEQLIEQLNAMRANGTNILDIMKNVAIPTNEFERY